MALWRGGAETCVNCLGRELRRPAWGRQAAGFSSQASDRKQPRRTHVKKAKAQPPVDVAKLLEQLFSQRRPGAAQSGHVQPLERRSPCSPSLRSTARPAKAASEPRQPPASSNVALLPNTEPAVYICPAAAIETTAPVAQLLATAVGPGGGSGSPAEPRAADAEAPLGPGVGVAAGAAATGGKEEDLDPVHKLYLEKIREYNNLRRLRGAAVEADPDHSARLSEETARLRRLHGGHDLSGFPQFTFTEPKMEQD